MTVDISGIEYWSMFDFWTFFFSVLLPFVVLLVIAWFMDDEQVGGFSFAWLLIGSMAAFLAIPMLHTSYKEIELVTQQLEEYGYEHVDVNWGSDAYFTASQDGQYVQGSFLKDRNQDYVYKIILDNN